MQYGDWKWLKYSRHCLLCQPFEFFCSRPLCIHFSQFVDVYVYRKQVFWAVKLRASCTNASVMSMLNSAEALYTHTHLFNGPLSDTTRVSRYQKAKTNLDFTEARDSEWQWHLLGYMQVCTLLQTDNHASTPPLRFLRAGCPSCRPTNSIKALKHYISIKCHRPFNC